MDLTSRTSVYLPRFRYPFRSTCVCPLSFLCIFFYSFLFIFFIFTACSVFQLAHIRTRVCFFFLLIKHGHIKSNFHDDRSLFFSRMPRARWHLLLIRLIGYRHLSPLCKFMNPANKFVSIIHEYARTYLCLFISLYNHEYFSLEERVSNEIKCIIDKR